MTQRFHQIFCRTIHVFFRHGRYHEQNTGDGCISNQNHRGKGRRGRKRNKGKGPIIAYNHAVSNHVQEGRVPENLGQSRNLRENFKNINHWRMDKLLQSSKGEKSTEANRENKFWLGLVGLPLEKKSY